ncbi:RED2 editase, partial [Polypterus senegalus]
MDHGSLLAARSRPRDTTLREQRNRPPPASACSIPRPKMTERQLLRCMRRSCVLICTSSAEVKENRNVDNLEECSIVTVDRQSFCCADASRGGTPGLKRKRPLEEGNSRHLCKLKLIYKKLSWSVTPKNALVQLNELKPGLQYKMVSQTGPVHAPVFSISVEVNGLTFEGSGPTKKKAKMRAAEMALKSFVQFPNASQAHFAMGMLSNASTDFTSDQADFPDTLFKEFEPAPHGNSFPCYKPTENELLSSAYRHGRLLCHTLDLMVQAKQNKHKMVSPTESEKNPVELLNELRPGLRYICLAETVERQHIKSFIMAVRVDGRTFEGSGRSKKQAKAQAAQTALQALFNIRMVPEGKTSRIYSRSKCCHLPQVRMLAHTAVLAFGRLDKESSRVAKVVVAKSTLTGRRGQCLSVRVNCIGFSLQGGCGLHLA